MENSIDKAEIDDFSYIRSNKKKEKKKLTTESAGKTIKF